MRRDAGLLQELEALSQALYKAGAAAPLAAAEPPPPSIVSRKDLQGRVHRRASEVIGKSNDERVLLKPEASRHSISGVVNSAHIRGQSLNLDDREAGEGEDGAGADIEVPLHKKGFWGWKPLRALAHLGQQRFPCEFTVLVQSIEKLPTSMNGLRFQVQLQHKDARVSTVPVRSSGGSVEFKETLQFQCTIYGSKKSNGTVKYMEKSFDMSVIATDVPELDLGKHRLDLSRILPAAPSASEAGNVWNTSFKLSGKAKGSTVWLSFSHEILHESGKGNKTGRPPIRSSEDKVRSFNSVLSSPQAIKKSFKHENDDEREPEAPRASLAPALAPPRQEMKAKRGFHDFDLRGLSLFPPLDGVVAPTTPGQSQEKQGEREESVEEQQEEVDNEFNVVEQGDVDAQLKEDVQDHHFEEPKVVAQEQVVVNWQAEQDENEEEEDEDCEEEDEDDEEIEEQQQLGRTAIDQEQEVEEEEVQEVEEDEENSSLNEEKLVTEEHAEVPVCEIPEDVEGSMDSSSDEAEIVAGEFLDMLEDQPASSREQVPGSDSPVSPRALLLKQFEQDEGGLQLEVPLEVDSPVPDIGLYEIGIPAPNVQVYEDDGDVTEALVKHAEVKQDSTTGWNSEEDKGLQVFLSKHYEDHQGLENEVKVSEDEDHLPLLVQKGADMKEEASAGWTSEDDEGLEDFMDAAESELEKATQSMKSKARAKMLEDAEAEALLQEWGLNEKVFHESPPHTAKAPPELETSLIVRQELPSLAPGVGAVVPTNDGGSLRSMHSSLFQGASNDGKLVMHVSKPVVVPADMGATAVDILQNFAGAGSENMTMEAMQAMPLEDITGKSVEQIAMEGQASFDESQQRYNAAVKALEYGSSKGELVAGSSTSYDVVASQQPKRRTGKQQQGSSDFLSLDELAPVAMEKIEELAMQGLKVQCEMSEEEAPYTIEAGTERRLLEAAGRSSDEAAGASSSEAGGMAMSLTLDEWMKLDAGLYDEAETNERTLSVLAAHGAAHATTTTDLILNLSGDSNSSSREQQSSGKLGSSMTLAMLVQLRDPLRNFEPVGVPMMALVEAERVALPPRPRLYKRVSLQGNSELEEDEGAQQPQFRITGVHMAGLKGGAAAAADTDASDPSRKKKAAAAWGSAKQQQSGSRWLIASGMAKSHHHPLLKPSAAKSSPDSLWSISSRIKASPSASASSNSSRSVVRNPDIKFAKVDRFWKR